MRAEALEALVGEPGVHVVEALVLRAVVGSVGDLGRVAAVVRRVGAAEVKRSRYVTIFHDRLR